MNRPTIDAATARQDGPLALVIGATGGIGGALAERLLAEGWRVRAAHRDPERARSTNVPAGLDWVKADALDAGAVTAAADEAEIIVHAVNPPAYRNWSGLQMPMLESSLAAARASGARILFPGTVYNYGPDVFPRIGEEAPQNPVTRKGAIRVRMETALREAGVRFLIVRAGDFFGPRPGNNWLSQGWCAPAGPSRPSAIPAPWRYITHGRFCPTWPRPSRGC